MLNSKEVIAVDIDEIIAAFFDSFVYYHNLFHQTAIQKNDVLSFRLHEIFKTTKDEMEERVIYFESSEYGKGIQPVEGSVEGISKLLNRGYKLHIVTARPTRLTGETKRWIEQHFPKKFNQIHFSINRHTKSDANENKAEVCKKIGATTLIDDNLDNAILCAENGIKVLLMDAPWNQAEDLSENITRVKDWQDILKVLK